LDTDEIPKLILKDAEKCFSCGFCESVCPTIAFGPHRGYGPRGRVIILRTWLRGEGEITEEGLASIYSCLLCNACSTVCPARIRVGDLVRDARALLWSRGLPEGIRVVSR
jgi:glycolate oxidase iron-sulfur subunit